MISFRRGKTKVRLIKEERISIPQNTTPLYAKGVHMLYGFANEEVNHFLEEHRTIVPLFEMDVIIAVKPYVREPATREILNQPDRDPTTIIEFCHAHDAFE